MEEASEAWSLLAEQVLLLLGTPREAEGTPGCALPPPRVWCPWRDLGRLAKRPSAIILNSGTNHKVRQSELESNQNQFRFKELSSVFPHTRYYIGFKNLK